MAHSTCGWQVKLSDPLSTSARLEHFRDEQLIIKRYTNMACFSLLLLCNSKLCTDVWASMVNFLRASVLKICLFATSFWWLLSVLYS